MQKKKTKTNTATRKRHACSVMCSSLWCNGACQAPLSWGFSRQEYSSGLPLPPPGKLSNPGIKPTSPALTSRFWFFPSHLEKLQLIEDISAKTWLILIQPILFFFIFYLFIFLFVVNFVIHWNETAMGLQCSPSRSPLPPPSPPAPSRSSQPILITALDKDDLNTPIKRQKLSELII